MAGAPGRRRAQGEGTMRGLIDWMLAWWRPVKPFYGENIEGDVL